MKQITITEPETIIPGRIVPAKTYVRFESVDGSLHFTAEQATQRDEWTAAKKWISLLPTHYSDVLEQSFYLIQSQEDYTELKRQFKVLDKHEFQYDEVRPDTIFPTLIAVHHLDGGDYSDDRWFYNGTDHIARLTHDIEQMKELFNAKI